jgi:hypothetical protein
MRECNDPHAFNGMCCCNCRGMRIIPGETWPGLPDIWWLCVPPAEVTGVIDIFPWDEPHGICELWEEAG